MILWNNTNPSPGGFVFRPAGEASRSRAEMLDRIMAREIWEEADLAFVLDVTIDTLRHMKSRAEIPGIVNLNGRKWLCIRDDFVAGLKHRGMPKATTGRPRGSKLKQIP